jgi:hypothetical protein
MGKKARQRMPCRYPWLTPESGKKRKRDDSPGILRYSRLNRKYAIRILRIPAISRFLTKNAKISAIIHR